MTKNKRRHRPEQIVAKLRDADVMLNTGKGERTVTDVRFPLLIP